MTLSGAVGTWANSSSSHSKPNAIMEYQLEYTDTYGGEANYSWVKRKTLTAPDHISDQALVRRAKKLMGISGRHRRVDMGDTIAIYPSGYLMVLFITPNF